MGEVVLAGRRNAGAVWKRGKRGGEWCGVHFVKSWRSGLGQGGRCWRTLEGGLDGWNLTWGAEDGRSWVDAGLGIWQLLTGWTAACAPT